MFVYSCLNLDFLNTNFFQTELCYYFQLKKLNERQINWSYHYIKKKHEKQRYNYLLVTDISAEEKHDITL